MSHPDDSVFYGFHAILHFARVCFCTLCLDFQMFSRVHHVHPARPSLSRVFYVSLTAQQVFVLKEAY